MSQYCQLNCWPHLDFSLFPLMCYFLLYVLITHSASMPTHFLPVCGCFSLPFWAKSILRNFLQCLLIWIYQKYAVLAFCCHGNMTENVNLMEERLMLAPGFRVLTLFCCPWAVMRWYPWWEYVGSNAAHSVAAKKLRERRERGERDRGRDSQSEKQIQRGTETDTGEQRRRKEEKKRKEGRMRKMKRKNGVEWRDMLGLNPPFPGHDSNDWNSSSTSFTKGSSLK